MSQVDQKDVQRRPPIVECDALPLEQQQSRKLKKRAEFNYGILLWLLVIALMFAKVLLGIVVAIVLMIKYPKLMFGGMLGLRSMYKRLRKK